MRPTSALEPDISEAPSQKLPGGIEHRLAQKEAVLLPSWHVSLSVFLPPLHRAASDTHTQLLVSGSAVTGAQIWTPVCCAHLSPRVQTPVGSDRTTRYLQLHSQQCHHSRITPHIREDVFWEESGSWVGWFEWHLVLY